MNKKILIVVALVSVLMVSAMYIMVTTIQQSNGETPTKPEPIEPEPKQEKFTVTIQPTELTMELFKEQNITVTFASTGYEGELSILIKYSYFGEEPPITLSTDMFFDTPSKLGESRTIGANETFTFITEIRWGDTIEEFTEPAKVTFRIVGVGNPNVGEQFIVISNGISITIMP